MLGLVGQEWGPVGVGGDGTQRHGRAAGAGDRSRRAEQRGAGPVHRSAKYGRERRLPARARVLKGRPRTARLAPAYYTAHNPPCTHAHTHTPLPSSPCVRVPGTHHVVRHHRRERVLARLVPAVARQLEDGEQLGAGGRARGGGAMSGCGSHAAALTPRRPADGAAQAGERTAEPPESHPRTRPAAPRAARLTRAESPTRPAAAAPARPRAPVCSRPCVACCRPPPGA